MFPAYDIWRLRRMGLIMIPIFDISEEILGEIIERFGEGLKRPTTDDDRLTIEVSLQNAHSMYHGVKSSIGESARSERVREISSLLFAIKQLRNNGNQDRYKNTLRTLSQEILVGIGTMCPAGKASNRILRRASNLSEIGVDEIVPFVDEIEIGAQAHLSALTRSNGSASPGPKALLKIVIGELAWCYAGITNQMPPTSSGARHWFVGVCYTAMQAIDPEYDSHGDHPIGETVKQTVSGLKYRK